MHRSLILACALALPLCARAAEQFVFRSPPEKDGVTWDGSTQLGASAASGNTQSLGVSGQARVARTDRRYRLSVGADLAYARSRVDVLEEQDGVAGVGPGELGEVVRTTREAWGVRVRGDRFVTRRIATFALAKTGGDRPSGKKLVTSGQLGVGLDVLSSSAHKLRLELAYDFTREDETGETEPLRIHSGRLFAGYATHLDEKLELELSSEVLGNVNHEARARGEVGPFGDTRLLQTATATYKLNRKLSLAMRASAGYDTAPSPRPPPPGTSFEPGYAPLASPWDTTADLVAIFSFL